MIRFRLVAKEGVNEDLVSEWNRKELEYLINDGRVYKSPDMDILWTIDNEEIHAGDTLKVSDMFWFEQAPEPGLLWDVVDDFFLVKAEQEVALYKVPVVAEIRAISEERARDVVKYNIDLVNETAMSPLKLKLAD